MDLSNETASGRVVTVGGDRSELLVENTGDVGGGGNTLLRNRSGWFGGIFIRLAEREPELGKVCVCGIGEFLLPNPVSCGGL